MRKLLLLDIDDNQTDVPLETERLEQRRLEEASGKIKDDPDAIQAPLNLDENENAVESNSVEEDSSEDSSIAKEELFIENAFINVGVNDRKDLNELVALASSIATEDNKEILEALSRHGFKYGKLAVTHLSKILLKILNGVYNGLIKSLEALIAFSKKREISFNKHLGTIDSLYKKVQKLDQEKEIFVIVNIYEKPTIVRSLCIDGSKNLIRNIRVAKTFSTSTIEAFLSYSIDSLTTLKIIISLVVNGKMKDPETIFAPSPNFNDFMPTSLSQYKIKNGSKIKVHRYKNKLPGNMAAILHLPIFNKNNAAEELSGYSKSQFFFDLEMDRNQITSEINYSSKAELIALLDLAKEICHVSLSHKSKYNQCINHYEQLSHVYKNYIDIILNKEFDITMRQSMIEIVSPAVYFIRHVCLFGTVKIDDYIGHLLKDLFQYINDNINHWNNLNINKNKT